MRAAKADTIVTVPRSKTIPRNIHGSLGAHTKELARHERCDEKGGEQANRDAQESETAYFTKDHTKDVI